jgi:hypothetical protein
MNRALPPGDRGNRDKPQGWPSRPARIVPSAGRLVGGVAVHPCHAGKEKPPRRNPGGERWPVRFGFGSGFDGIVAGHVFAFRGFNRKAQLLADRARQVPTNGMRLPASRLHQFFECRAVRPFQQLQDLRSFAALVGAFGRLHQLRALWLFRRLLSLAGLSFPTWASRPQHGACVRQCWPFLWLSAPQPGLRPGRLLRIRYWACSSYLLLWR